MARRGDVVELHRPAGFGAAVLRHAVVVQSDLLNQQIGTYVLVPLDIRQDIHFGHPGAIPVSATEAGLKHEQVALVASVFSAPADRVEKGAQGSLLPATLARLDDVLRRVLSL